MRGSGTPFIIFSILLYSSPAPPSAAKCTCKRKLRLDTGVRGVNAHPGGGPGTPFGGVKQSGIGVEGGGELGLKEFVDVTTLRIAKKGLKK